LTLWAGRLEGGMAPELAAMSISLGFDQQLGLVDVLGSAAHVRGLGRTGILSDDETQTLLSALEQVTGELSSGSFVFVESDEDIHTAVERRVTEIAGPVGGKLHTGRSRNDQVATDLRLWSRGALLDVAASVLALQRVLSARASEAGSVYLPGYTHLQRAQPVLLSHHLAAHCWAFSRDVDRLLASVHRLNVSPLGAGALAGSSLPLDPDGVAEELGFAKRFDNSMDAVSDRDFVAEALFDIALVGLHCSRLGEEIVLFTSEEFGFFTLDNAYATGSSMLPQKKNADIGELARGKSGRLIGDLVGFLATMKALPLSYNRDLQEDKEPLFDAVRQIRLVLDALTGLYATVAWSEETMARAADESMSGAIDLAEYLVKQGMPFRQAHGVVAGIVTEALEKGVPLGGLVEAHEALGPDAAALLAPGRSVANRQSPGGTGPAAVEEQLNDLGLQIQKDTDRIEALIARWSAKN